ncbi:cobyric acid synthase [Salpingoeca rosetta]|uniref:Cobyric acid synthase n=1 Tax=Salpingoeca rosetta (strain ATCC 50818 / BSB-021) TaxID=946362 RepID=F2UKN3_SALR5|nr:cobyric acid synthase [Salpingoeca rosetta]EGD77682.1 cobyric acid synthase [Salpingoeca rosetta]|eukprot:XP_004990158.1 cobyric acid synthase [Salpingoeca rosetta]
MPLEAYDHRRSARTRRVHALYEIAHTAVDFAAAMSFLVGSILFLWSKYQIPGVWLFIVGSFFFCVKPTLRLSREIHLWHIGKVEALSRQAPEEEARQQL